MPFVDFLKVGVPTTLMTIALAAIYLVLYVFVGAVETNIGGAVGLAALAAVALLRWQAGRTARRPKAAPKAEKVP